MMNFVFWCYIMCRALCALYWHAYDAEEQRTDAILSTLIAWIYTWGTDQTKSKIRGEIVIQQSVFDYADLWFVRSFWSAGGGVNLLKDYLHEANRLLAINSEYWTSWIQIPGDNYEYNNACDNKRPWHDNPYYIKGSKRNQNQLWLWARMSAAKPKWCCHCHVYMSS